jgi:hypothetical protein
LITTLFQLLLLYRLLDNSIRIKFSGEKQRKNVWSLKTNNIFLSGNLQYAIIE